LTILLRIAHFCFENTSCDLQLYIGSEKALSATGRAGRFMAAANEPHTQHAQHNAGRHSCIDTIASSARDAALYGASSS